MTQAVPPDEPGKAGFEVATVSADSDVAVVRVSGAVDAHTLPLLLGVLRTHVRAGRRTLRVDFAAAVVDDPDVLGPLGRAYATMVAAGGELEFTNAPDQVAALIAGDLIGSVP